MGMGEQMCDRWSKRFSEVGVPVVRGLQFVLENCKLEPLVGELGTDIEACGE
jgi:hypothetical protein